MRVVLCVIDLYHGATILNFSRDTNDTKPSLEEQNSLVPIWFQIAKWLLAFIIVIRYEEVDQDVGIMMKVGTMITGFFAYTAAPKL